MVKYGTKELTVEWRGDIVYYGYSEARFDGTNILAVYTPNLPPTTFANLDTMKRVNGYEAKVIKPLTPDPEIVKQFGEPDIWNMLQKPLATRDGFPDLESAKAWAEETAARLK